MSKSKKEGGAMSKSKNLDNAIPQHRKLAMGEKVTGTALKKGGAVMHKSKGGKAC